MNMHTCVYAYTYIHIYTYICIYVYVNVYVYIYVYVYVCIDNIFFIRRKVGVPPPSGSPHPDRHRAPVSAANYATMRGPWDTASALCLYRSYSHPYWYGVQWLQTTDRGSSCTKPPSPASSLPRQSVLQVVLWDGPHLMLRLALLELTSCRRILLLWAQFASVSSHKLAC